MVKADKLVPEARFAKGFMTLDGARQLSRAG